MREHGGQVLAGSKPAGNSGFETRTRSESPTKANSPAGSFVQEPTRMHPSISGGWCWVTEVREQETVQLPLPARGSNPGSLGCDPGALPLRNRLPERTNWSPSSKGSGTRDCPMTSPCPGIEPGVPGWRAGRTTSALQVSRVHQPVAELQRCGSGATQPRDPGPRDVRGREPPKTNTRA